MAGTRRGKNSNRQADGESVASLQAFMEDTKCPKKKFRRLIEWREKSFESGDFESL